MLGRPLSEAIPGLWSALNDTDLLNGQNDTGEQEVRCVFEGGRRVPLALTATPVTVPSREEQGSGYAFMLRDLGEIRRLQAEIRIRTDLPHWGILPQA